MLKSWIESKILGKKIEQEKDISTFVLEEKLKSTALYRNKLTGIFDCLLANRRADVLLEKYENTNSIDEKVKILYNDRNKIRYLFDYFYKSSKYLSVFYNELVNDQQDEEIYSYVMVAQNKILKVETMIIEILLEAYKVTKIKDVNAADVTTEKDNVSCKNKFKSINGYDKFNKEEEKEIAEGTHTLRGVNLKDEHEDLFYNIEKELTCYCKEIQIVKKIVADKIKKADVVDKVLNLISVKEGLVDKLQCTNGYSAKVKVINEILTVNYNIYNELGYANKLDKAVSEGFDIILMEQLYSNLYKKFEITTQNYENEFKGLNKKNKMHRKDVIKLVRDALSEVYGKEYVKHLDDAFKDGRIIRDENKQYTDTGRTFNMIHCKTLNTLDSGRILIHEAGHLVEQEIEMEDDISVIKKESISIEIPSSVNEFIYLEYLLEHFENKENLNNELKVYIFSFVNLTTWHIFLTFAENAVLDKIISNNDKHVLNETYIHELNEDFEILTLIQDDSIKFDKMDFYFCRYVYGLLIGLRIVQNLKQDKTYIDRYMEFLKVREKLDMNESMKYLDIDLNDSTLLTDYLEYVKKLVDKVNEYERFNK